MWPFLMKTQPSPTPPPRSRLKSVLTLGGKIAVSAGLLVWLFSRVDFVRLWSYARTASAAWLIAALGVYTVTLLIGTWRWSLLLGAQAVKVPGKHLVSSYLVATFFNNFLPSNIGGDVIRIRDTVAPAGSKTLATTIVLIDRGIGLLGLVLVAAVGASAGADLAGSTTAPVWPPVLWGSLLLAMALSAPAVLVPEGVGRMLQPLRVFHHQWVTDRIVKITDALGRFRERPEALAGCFGGAVAVQALMVVFYVSIAHSMRIPVSPWHLAVIVPMSFVVQMLPVSVNGFGVREATFSFYFTRLGLPIESALIVSFVGAALVILFSVSGGVVYLSQTVNHHLRPVEEAVD